MTEGLPREINVVASQAMLNAYVENTPAVKRRHVRATRHDYGFEGVRVDRGERAEIAKAVPLVDDMTMEPAVAPSEPSELIRYDEEISIPETQASSPGRRALALTIAAVATGILGTLALAAFLVYPSGGEVETTIPEPPPASSPRPSSTEPKSPPPPVIASELPPPEPSPATTSTPPEPGARLEVRLDPGPEDAAPFEAPPPQPVSTAAAASDHLERGTWLARNGSLDEAIAAFREALALDPGYADAFYNLGASLLKKGRVEEAIEALRHAVSLSPHDGLAQRALGMALRQSGELVGAAVSLQRAVDLLPNDVIALRHLASVLRDSGDMEKAIDATQRAISLEPDDAGLQQELGYSLRAAGRLAEATVALQRSIEIDANVALAHYTLGVTLLEMGNQDAGEREIAEARRLGYEPR
jgi:Flp pilus assembly protein TadD